MSLLRSFVLISTSLAVGSTATAQTRLEPTAESSTRQDRAVVVADAPVMLLPDPNRTPLRVAATGSVLIALQEEAEWVRVQFQDPQLGRREGYIQSKFLRIQRASLMPMNLSVPEATTEQRSPVQLPGAPQAPVAVGPPARPPLVRSGFWFSAGMGYGALSCDTCIGHADGFSGGLAAGGTISDRWLLGGGTTGWYRSDDGVWLSASTLEFRARFYPVRTSGFFINGGIGLGDVSVGIGRFSVTESDMGVGSMFGFGWDVRVGAT